MLRANFQLNEKKDDIYTATLVDRSKTWTVYGKDKNDLVDKVIIEAYNRGYKEIGVSGYKPGIDGTAILRVDDEKAEQSIKLRIRAEEEENTQNKKKNTFYFILLFIVLCIFAGFLFNSLTL